MTSDKQKIDQLRVTNYDGIREFDNDLPKWWVWLFYLTVAYGVVYVIARLTTGATIPPIPFDPPLLAANETPAPVQPAANEDEDKRLALVIADGSRAAKGKEIYTQKCAVCHGPAGGGLVGPNLTDNFWIHGNRPSEIRSTIENGVLEKGMLAWKAQISKDDIDSLIAFIASIKGTNPLGAKGSEGKEYQS